MAEAIGVASAVTTLIATAYKSSKTLYYILSGIKNAPRHLHLLSCGLEDLYLVLGTIQAMLDDQESAQGILQSTASENLTNVLQNSLDVLSRISMIVKAYASGGTSMDISTWQRVKWTFKEKEIDDLRKRLLDHKITLNLTISVANLYNTTCTADRIETEIIELREKLPNILQQLEEVKENQLPQAMAHRAIDRAAVSTDYRLALRHYLNDEVSVITEITTPTTPSIQVSSLGVSHSRTTSEYWTAPTQRASETGLTTIPELCTQLFVSNVAIFKTLVIRVHSKDRIEKVKNNIRQRAALPNACFELPYAGHVLSEERSLEELNIAHNSTITCVSFRPNGRDERSIATPGTTYVAEAIISVRVKTPNGGIYHTVKVSEEVKQEDLVAFVASELSVLTGVDPEDTKLIHAGEVCRIGEPLHRPSIYLDGSIKMYLIIPGQEASDQQADYLESIFMSNRSDSTHPCPPSFEFDSEFTAKVHKVLSSVFEKDFVALVPLDAT